MGTYTEYQENTNFENGILTYLNNAAIGDLRELLKDVGISTLTNPYTGVNKLIEEKDKRVLPSDVNFKNLMNARFTLIDMTDYETDWSGPNETDGNLQFTRLADINYARPE